MYARFATVQVNEGKLDALNEVDAHLPDVVFQLNG